MKKVFLLFFILTSFMFAENGVTDTEIVIGISNATEGPAKFLGLEFLTGAKSYFAYINKNGGINGRKITIKHYNDGYEPKQCIINTKKLINDDKVFSLFGYVGTPTANAVLPMVQEAKIPFLFPFTGAGFLRDTDKASYVFNLRGTYDMETEKMVDYLVKKGKKKIAIFYQNDSFGKAGLSGTNKALDKRGLKLISEATYERNTVDVKDALLKIKKTNPDAVIMIGTYKPCSVFIKRGKMMGMKDVEFLNISFVGSKALAGELISDTDNVIISQVVPLPWDTSLDLIKEYQLTFKQELEIFTPGFVNLEGYLAAKLFVEGLKKAGKDLTRDSFIKGLESINNYDLGSGLYITFSPTDHQGLDETFFTTIRDRRFVDHK